MKWMNMMIRTFISLLCMGCVAIALTGFPPGALAQDRIATGEINYQNIQLLIQTSPIPMRLPSVLVYADNELSTGSFYGDGGYLQDRYNQTTGYNVSIMDSLYCDQALSCTIAYATAERITSETQPLDAVYAWMLVPGEGMDQYLSHAGHAPGWITLSGGQQVYIVPWLNGGAGSGFEEILWDENGYRYTIGLKWGDPAWLIQMVESIFNP